MYYCKKCLYPSTKPDLWFREDGICGACSCFSARDDYDWNSARKQFHKIIKQNKKNPRYDCIVPVSGGKDSTYQVWRVLQEGYNPLCVTAPTDFLTPIGRRNIENLKNIGADYIEISVHKDVRKAIAKHSLFAVGDIQWSEHLLIYTVPVRIAVNFNIPVIVWGECPQREYGAGKPEDAHLVLFDRRVLEEYGSLNGQRVTDLLSIPGVQSKDLFFYEYPDTDAVETVGVKGIYLDNYFQWHGLSNLVISQSLGFEVSPHNIRGTITNYENLDNYVHGIHDYFKYLKFGFSRATDIACNLIRRGMLSREEAVFLVSSNDGAFPSQYLDKSLPEILEYYGISRNDFDKVCDDYTNYSLFEQDSNGDLKRRPDGSPALKADFSTFQAREVD
jgi:N-acetyl sugar amidotransferase